MAAVEFELRPRDRGLEQRLVALAAQVCGRSDDGGLLAYAGRRAHPGGVRVELDADKEAAEELADCCNYLVWGIQQVWPAYQAGDPDAARVYERRMRTLVTVVRAWVDLHTHAG